MSLRMAIGAARLTVLGSGWSDTTIESGDGFTIDGQLWEDIADLLNYDFGDDVDWDDIAESEYPDFDWSKVIYETPDGTIYTDPNGTGIWTDPLTGLEYPGGGNMYVPESEMVKFSDKLGDLAAEDSGFVSYSIPQETLNSLPIGGPTSRGGSNPAHLYSPPARYYILSSNSIIFTSGQLSHKAEGGSEFVVVEASFAIHGSESRTAYFDNCHPLYQEVGGASIVSLLPSAYSGLSSSCSDVRHKYLVWQLCYGSFDGTLIETTPDTISTEDIQSGTSGLDTIDYAEQRYYRMKDRQVADRV